jgi:hypothetical protein
MSIQLIVYDLLWTEKFKFNEVLIINKAYKNLICITNDVYIIIYDTESKMSILLATNN